MRYLVKDIATGLYVAAEPDKAKIHCNECALSFDELGNARNFSEEDAMKLVEDNFAVRRLSVAAFDKNQAIAALSGLGLEFLTTPNRLPTSLLRELKTKLKNQFEIARWTLERMNQAVSFSSELEFGNDQKVFFALVMAVTSFQKNPQPYQKSDKLSAAEMDYFDSLSVVKEGVRLSDSEQLNITTAVFNFGCVILEELSHSVPGSKVH